MARFRAILRRRETRLQSETAAIGPAIRQEIPAISGADILTAAKLLRFGSGEAEQRSLVSPGERQINGLKGSRGEAGWLPSLDDGGDDIGC